ncbi:MAG: thiolase family protein [Bdellovibrionales bacterium]|nr:thiolase family protein [Bdellovibrionales bacterium]
MSQKVFILSAQRTPVGSFQGALSTLPAPQLGATAIRAAVAKAQVKPERIKECIMGEVLTAGVGQAPARQAALGAGLSSGVPCMTVNKVCGSGLKAVMLASDSIRLNHSDMVVAGGQENMTLSPHLLENVRAGYRMGHVQAMDSMIRDGLWDPYNNWHMGNAAELCVREYKIGREEQDRFAIESYAKAQKAQKQGLFKKEITTVEIPGRKETIKVDTDEEPGKARFDKMAELKPAFERDGTITAANASKINDGAAALVLTGEEVVQKEGFKPIARIVSHATFAQDPKWFTTAPVGAMKLAMEIAGLKTSEIGWWEINEAFSVVTLVAMKELKLSKEQVNPHGGAVAIGHPIGASGARIFTTLIHGLHQRGQRYGMASLCIGGGEAVAVIVEKL